MFKCFSDNCLKVSKFHVFFRKNRKKVKKSRKFDVWMFCDNCLKISKFHVFFRKNRKKVEKSSKFDV